MGKIVTLQPELVNKIAAGEVIDRPASIIKELIENSIDAKSDTIRINIQKGGIEMIEIADNGKGMTPEDARICFQQHTTSKIKSLSDLNKIFTFGFRGEALSSVCAISQTTIHTKSPNSKPIELSISNGVIQKETLKPRTEGTTIRTYEIFRYLPARKKFLKSPTTEFKHIYNNILNFAYIHPSISFEITHNNKQIAKIYPAQNLKERFLNLHKNIQSNDLVEITYKSSVFSINGLVIKPSKIEDIRKVQNLYLNERIIKERSLRKAIMLAYQSLIPQNQQPSFIINISMDPKHIDVNIHPQKLEAKIENVNQIFSALKNTIRNQLDKEMQNEMKNKFKNFSSTSGIYQNYPNKSLTNKQSLLKDIDKKNYSNTKINLKPSKPQIQQSLDFTKTILSGCESVNTYKILQIFDTYIIIEKENALEIIDQHAAAERINFEKIWHKFQSKEEIETQNMLIPIEVDIKADDIIAIEEYINDIKKLGIDIDIFGKTKIKINTIPVFAREINHKELINEILETITEFQEANIDKLQKKIAESIACHTSIRAGQRLSKDEIYKLIKDLENTTSPYSCPHGRPIIWTLPKNEIEKKFKRIL